MTDEGHSEASTMLYELGVVEADRAFLETEDSTTTTTSNEDGQGVILWPTWPLTVGASGSAFLELHDLTLSIALYVFPVSFSPFFWS